MVPKLYLLVTRMTLDNNNALTSRQESKFLALLTRTQQKASKITGAARRTFANTSKRQKKISNSRCNKILIAKRSSSNESASASSGNEKAEGNIQHKYLQKTNIGRLSLSSAHTSDGECFDSSEEHLNDNNVWKSIEESAQNYDWRLPKYVETLEIWLQDLEKHPQGPKKETIAEYKLKVEFLKKVVTTLEDEKLEVESRHVNSASVNDENGSAFPRRKPSLPSHRGSPSGGFSRRQISAESSSVSSKTFSVLPHGQASTADVISKEIHQKLESRQTRNLRNELFDINSGYTNDIDHMSSTSNSNPYTNMLHTQNDSNDLDHLLQVHHSAQEKVADEMLCLTKSLKEQTRAAGEIVRKDTNVIERSTVLAEANAAKLQLESDRLAEHTGSACRCWVWFLLAIVCITFIAMVMVMKIFRKRWHNEL